MRNIIKKFLALLIILIIMLIVLEVTIRVINKDGTFFEYDNLVGSKHIKNAEGEYKSGEFKNYVKINSDGWYDNNYNITKDTKVKRIIILGDSIAEALQVSINDSFQQIIENDLNKNNKKVELINLGVSGYGTGQEYVNLQKEGLKYEPDIVLLIFMPNDVRNNDYELQKSNFKPYFDINSTGELYLSKKPLEGNNFIVNSLIIIYNKLLKYSKLLSFVQLQVIKKLDSNVISKKITNVDNPTKINNIPIDVFLYNKTYDKSFEKAWDITEKLIKSTRELSENNNAKFIMIINLEDIAAINEDYKKYGLDLDYDKPSNILKEICKKDKIDCIDLYKPLKEYKDKNNEKELFFKINGHLTKIGHELIANELKNKLAVYIE